MSEAKASPSENHCQAGRRGEDHALDHLIAKGYSLVHRNYRHGRGEIDLIMESPEKVLVFVEVKANRGRMSGRPLERIDGRKIRRIQRVAQRFCWEFRQENRDMRFDVVGVTLSAIDREDDEVVPIEHIENAFIPDGDGYYPSR